MLSSLCSGFQTLSKLPPGRWLHSHIAPVPLRLSCCFETFAPVINLKYTSLMYQASAHRLFAFLLQSVTITVTRILYFPWIRNYLDNWPGKTDWRLQGLRDTCKTSSPIWFLFHQRTLTQKLLVHLLPKEYLKKHQTALFAARQTLKETTIHNPPVLRAHARTYGPVSGIQQKL